MGQPTLPLNFYLYKKRKKNNRCFQPVPSLPNDAPSLPTGVQPAAFNQRRSNGVQSAAVEIRGVQSANGGTSCFCFWVQSATGSTTCFCFWDESAPGARQKVFLLGDEVDTLLGLLEKLYIALDHYSPILQHYPGIMRETMNEQLVDSARLVIFKEYERSVIEIKGYDFNRGVNYSELLKSLVSTGFQDSSLGDAMGVVNEMLEWSCSDESLSDECIP